MGKQRPKTRLIVILFVTIQVACSPPTQDLTDDEIVNIKSDVTTAIMKYKEDIIAGNGENIVEMYSKSPDFRWVVNDRFMSYEDQARNARRRTTSMNFNGDLLKEINVNVLSRESAVVLAKIDYQFYRDLDTLDVKGVANYVLKKEAGSWKIIQGQIHNNRLSNYDEKPK